MTQLNGNRRARAWAVALLLVLAAGALASCGGSSKSTQTGANQTGANATTSASSTSPPPAQSEGSASSGNGTGGTPSNGKPDPASPKPIARASRFVACMRAHGINLPAAEKSSGGSATLDFRGVDTKSAKYTAALDACARALVGGFKTGKLRGHTVPLAGIHVRGIRLAKVRIGQIKLPGLHIPAIKLPNLNLPPIHVTTPPVHVTTPGPNLGGRENGSEPPTTTQGSTG